VLADFRLGELAVVERAAVHVGVAVQAAEVSTTATVKTCSAARQHQVSLLTHNLSTGS